jgi:hypothetical protein
MTAGFSQWMRKKMDEIYLASWINNPIAARMVKAAIIILLGFIIARLIGRLTRRILQAVELNDLLKRTGFAMQAEQAISYILEISLYTASIIYALNVLGLEKAAAISLLAIVFLVIITSLIGIMYSLPSFMAGFRIRKRLKEGQNIKITRVRGKIDSIHLSHTIVIGKNGERIRVPNRLLRSADSFKH